MYIKDTAQIHYVHKLMIKAFTFIPQVLYWNRTQSMVTYMCTLPSCFTVYMYVHVPLPPKKGKILMKWKCILIRLMKIKWNIKRLNLNNKNIIIIILPHFFYEHFFREGLSARERVHTHLHNLALNLRVKCKGLHFALVQTTQYIMECIYV